MRASKLFPTPAICVLAFAGLVCGCEEPHAKTSALAPEERQIQMGAESLFISGEDWVFRYDHEGNPCAIVGDGVGFVEREEDHVVVDAHGQTLFNVPTGLHFLLVVDTAGSRAVPLRPGDYGDDKALLTAALSAEQRH